MHCLPKILHGMHQFKSRDSYRKFSKISRFSDARVNWAENMLRCRSETKVAIIEASSVNFHLMGGVDEFTMSILHS